MRSPSRLLAAAVAVVISTPTSSQVPSIAYSHHWAPMADPVSTGFSGPALFSFGGAPGFASAGDAIRRCYGIDTTQGGRNQSTGRYESTNFRILQGWAPANAVPGLDIGLVSVQAGSSSDSGADVCFSPFLKMAGDTGGHSVAAAALIGTIGATAGFPVPTFWDVAFQWTGTGTGFHGVSGPATLGIAGPGPFASPLLVNVIYEVQGPLNGGPTNHQYYLGSLAEKTGEGNSTGGGGAGPGTPAVYGTGGVTNGNPAWGSTVFGVDATTSGAISHSRILATGPGGAVTFTFPAAPGASHVELGGFLSFQTPFLWASNDGSIGAGGADPIVSTAPTSTIDLHYQDHLAGAQGTAAVYGGLGGPSAVFTPGLVFNAPVFLWSSTPAATLPQAPMSWDDLGGVVPPSPGSLVLGPQATLREGPQTVPINFDSTSSVFLGFPGLTFGTPFTESEDLFLDGLPAGASSSYFEGAFGPITSGVSTLGGGAAAIASPAPALAGATLGVAAIGVQFNALTGVVGLTEVGSSLEMNLQ